MATYQVWLTVKDEYGNTKEVDGGNIDVDANLDDLNQEEINSIEKALLLEDYIKRENLSIELNSYATTINNLTDYINRVEQNILANNEATTEQLQQLDTQKQNKLVLDNNGIYIKSDTNGIGINYEEVASASEVSKIRYEIETNYLSATDVNSLLNKTIGDIESALDSIIDIQNQLISGGNA